MLYISPLKALAVDVERNLRAPLAGISNVAGGQGLPFHTPTIAVRTGDTPAAERAKFQKAPADILITTPESLFLLLTSNAHESLRSVETVIIDEIHALVSTKRGAHLALSLERLERIAHKPLQRIGLSATQRPLDEVARYLGGASVSSHDDGDQEHEAPRPSRLCTRQPTSPLPCTRSSKTITPSRTGRSRSSMRARRRSWRSPCRRRSKTWRDGQTGRAAERAGVAGAGGAVDLELDSSASWSS